VSNQKNQIDDFFTTKRDFNKRKSPLFDFKKFKKNLTESLPSWKQLLYLPKVLSKKERYLFILLALILIISLIYLPLALYFRNTEEVAAYGGTYKEGIIGEPHLINPLLSQSNDADKDLVNIIYSGLLKYDDAGNFVNDLAESYEISSDGLRYRFRIKDNAFWHDGTPVTADDVVFTIKTAQNYEYNSSQILNWQGIEANKIDDKTVQFILKSKYAQFLNNATLGILPQKIWQDIKPNNFALSDLNTKPIGSGPFKFKKLKKDSLGRIRVYELDSFEKYYNGKPFIDNLDLYFYSSEDEMIQAYNKGDFQGLSFISPSKLSQIKFQQRLDLNVVSIPRYFAIFFNKDNNSRLAEKNVRLALNYGTDRQKIVDDILSGKGTPIYSPTLPEILHIGEPLNKYSYDQSFANQILDNSGWNRVEDSRQKNSKVLEIKLTTSDWPELILSANLIKEQWEKIGVKVNLEILPISELQQKIKGRDYEALLFGEVLSANLDPFSFWHSSHKKDPGVNLSLYSNETADKLLQEARQTVDPIERSRKYDDFQRILLEDAPAVFLYSPSYVYAPNKKVKGIDLKLISIPSDRFNNIGHWYIETKRIKNSDQETAEKAG